MRFETVKKFAEKPSVILPSMVLGILCGYFIPVYHNTYSAIGDFYLSLLEMCVLPVMSTAIISSFGNLLHGHKMTQYLKKLVTIFILSLLGASLVAIILSVVLRPGALLSSSALAGISHAILQSQGHVGSAVTTAQHNMSLWSFFTNLVPNNIFAAFSNGASLSVLCVSILVGIAIGLQHSAAAKDTLNVAHTIYLAFLKIIGWIMIGLPVGLFFVFAAYVSSAGLELLGALSTLIALVILCGVVMMLIFAIIIRYRTGYKIHQIVYMLRQPLSLAFFTSSSLATMPMVLNALKNNFKLNENVTSLVVPIGTTLNQQASAIRYVCVALFVLQMYGLHLQITDLPLLMITSVLAAVAGAGLPGIAAITLSSFVFQSLGLPVAVGIVLLTILEPLIDPVTTMVNVFGNCMATTLIAAPSRSVKAKLSS